MRPCETDGHVYILQLSECYCEDEGCSECFNNQALMSNYFTRFGTWPQKTFTGPVYVCGDPGVRCEDCTFTGLLPEENWPWAATIQVTVWPPGHTGNPSDEHWRLYDHDASQSYYSPSAMECYLPGDYLTAGGAASDWLGEEVG